MIHFTYDDRTYTACGRSIGDAIANPNVSWTTIRKNVTCKNCLRQMREIPATRTPETFPCRWCGKPTRMLNTRECNVCLELRYQIESNPKLARRMLNIIEENQS